MSTETTESVRVHRHRDRVAVSADGFPTFYVSADDAEALASVLRSFAGDIRTFPRASQSRASAVRIGADS